MNIRHEINFAFKNLIDHPDQIMTLDANFLIPPDRSEIRKFDDFTFFKDNWLDPLFQAFPNLTIHEAVYDELVMGNVKSYADNQIQKDPPLLRIHRDSDLTSIESYLRNTFENKIYPNTKYIPSINNRHDRGEVKSLSYIAVKNLLYFASNDSNTIRLVEEADILGTSLDKISIIKNYEIIFYFHKIGLSTNKGLKFFYKYLYYATPNEQQENPNWESFIMLMDSLYGQSFTKKALF